MIKKKVLPLPDQPSFTDFIIRKARGEDLTEGDLRTLVGCIADGRVLPEQLAAWVMAVYFKGLNAQETAVLTDETVLSGEVLDLTDIGVAKVGFRDVGGLGDPCALVLTSLVAACGVVVPTMTDATESPVCNDLFKLQAIPGFQTDLPVKNCIQQLKKVRGCFCSQPTQTVPVDQIVSKIRKNTATEAIIPLLASSLLSRLLSVGAENIVMDIKSKGRLFKDDDAAQQLANMVTRTMRSLKHRCVVLSSNIPQPIGNTVGAVLEIRNIIELLHGRGDPALLDLIVKLGMEMVRLSGVCGSTLSAKKTVTEHLNDGSAFEAFKAIVKAQGGDVSYLEHPEKFPKAKHIRKLQIAKRGYIHSVDIALLEKGLEILMHPDASGKIDPTIGIGNVMKAGMPIVPSDVLLEVHYNDESNLDAALDCFRSAFCLTPKRPAVAELEIERFA